MEISPTRSALLESRDERQVMQEGYRFLDEKRLLLAAEIIKFFNRYQELQTRFQQLHRQAVLALEEAVVRHGLHGVQVEPASEMESARIKRMDRIFFGVPLVDGVELDPGEVKPPGFVLYPSPEKRSCKRSFSELTALTLELAALSGNLHRLLAEYQRTERRARALEDVILPELDAAIHEMDIRLEELEQEEAVRVRLGRMGE
ncbi:MAG: V-type ATP synthase subunit D [Magnetococcus sp. YQC-5]